MPGPVPKIASTLAILAGLFAGLTAWASVNVYTNASGGKWETATNWSLGAPFTNHFVFITNSGTKTVTIDSTTSASFTNTMTVADLTISSTNTATNTLLLANAGTNTPLHVISNLTLLPGGALIMTNSALTVDNGLPASGTPDVEVAINGLATINDSVLNTTNVTYTIVGGGNQGQRGSGTLNMTNSSFAAHNLFVGYLDNSTATFVNSDLRLDFGLTMGGGSATTGNLAIYGGRFIATNTIFSPGPGLVALGVYGTANVTVSNADVQFGNTSLGGAFQSTGSLTLQSGTMTLGKTFLGDNGDPRPPGPTTTGLILIQGGQMSMPELHIGLAATGMVTVAGGFLSNSITILAETNGAAGTLNITGGTNYISSSLYAGTNGSSAQVSVTGGALYVTNAAGTATTTLNGGSLLHGAGVFKTDNLILTNGGSVITVSNYTLGATAGTTNNLSLSSGSSLVISNAVLGLGNNGTTNNGSGNASATLSNATITATTINLGSTAGGLGSITIKSNATVNVSSNLTLVSRSISSTSSVTIVGGSLNASNATISVGSSGSGQMTFSGGTAIVRKIDLGGGPGTSGNLTLSGGAYLQILSSISANSIVVNASFVGGNGGTVIIGQGHNAGLTVISGSVTNFGTMLVGYTSDYTGSFTNFGVVSVTGNAIVGDCGNNVFGQVVLEGGVFYVTNAAHTAVLDVRNGSLTLNSGATLVVDNLILANACGHFIRNGGTLIAANTSLVPNLDADGDGQSNTNEVRAGTDPLDPNSTFRLLGVAIQNNHDIRVDWSAVGGHNYMVQAATNLDESQSAIFRDVSPLIQVLGTNVVTTNYVHIGGATNPAAYYRIHLVP